MLKNLVIVESPAKAKTIERFLGKDYVVKSSMGHVMDLSKKDLGVDINKGYAPKYEVAKEKQKIVSDLKKLAHDAEFIWLATDEDREGEAISWHLFNALKLKDEKTRRIVFHEITKNAIQHAIANPRSIDRNLVYAQQARRVLDRLVGFELSPLLWKKIKPDLSAGRVQSVAVRLIVEREEEIRNFVSTSSYRVTAEFLTLGEKKARIAAELPKRFAKKEDAFTFVEKCIGAEFKVFSIDTKPAKKSPAPPFTTSTLQQEASRKLGFSVANTMRLAQQLYESGFITYMRTDSYSLSNLALAMAKEEITKLYGAEYVKTRQYQTKTKGAQEAHEAIRPTYLINTTIEGNAAQKKLYELIWKRTIASQMSDAILEKTDVDISVSKVTERFVAHGEVIKFDGFLKVYIESTDEEEGQEKEGLLPPLKVGEPLGLEQMVAEQRFTQPPWRFTEASLVKKLEELGIGRPSTYAPIISTIQEKRGYVQRSNIEGYERSFVQIILKNDNIKEYQKTEKAGFEKGKLVPTDLGVLVNRFLVEYFDDIIDYNFTASVEKEFDEIAQGRVVWNKMIDEFYKPFHKQVRNTEEKTRKFSGERHLGTDPASGKNVYVKMGYYGPFAQIGEVENEEKPRFAGMKKGQSLETITLEEALELFKFPRNLGLYEDQEMMVGIGRFGPYIRHNNQFYSLSKQDDPATITQDRAVEIIELKKRTEKEKVIREFDKHPKISILRGMYGPYISDSTKNYRIPKGQDPEQLTYEDCLKIIQESAKKPAAKKTARRKK